MNEDIKEKAREMRKQGVSIIKIAKQLKVAKSSVSVWTRGITLTFDQRTKLAQRFVSDEQALAHSNTFRIRRQQSQDKGKDKIRKGESLYIAGCMLYWGEGSKNVNMCQMTNSELPMLQVFKRFLVKYFDVSNDMISIAINAYTDLHSQSEINTHWLDGLQLPFSSLRAATWDQYPKSSKGKVRKSEYGTCSLRVHKTEIVQEIFGAIQEFGNFTNDSWLK